MGALWGETVAELKLEDVEVLSAIFLVILDADSLDPEVDDEPDTSTLPGVKIYCYEA